MKTLIVTQLTDTPTTQPYINELSLGYRISTQLCPDVDVACFVLAADIPFNKSFCADRKFIALLGTCS